MYKIFKKIVYFFVFCVLVGSCLIHIVSQYNVLVTAKSKNNAYDKEINSIVIDNKVMRQKIMYATSSAFLESRFKGELGLGGEGDYKIIMNDKSVNIDLYPINKNSENLGTLQKWLKLFTL